MKRLFALCLALLFLPSCASMLEREYTEAVAHVEDQPPAWDAAYRVETYPALRSAILSYVEEGVEEGLLRCPTTYPGNLSVDLEKAKRQLMEEEPLGCYALEDMTFRATKIIAYYEVEMDFTYKVDREELTSLPKAANQRELATLLKETLDRGETRRAVYLTFYPEADEQFFSGALELAQTPDPDQDPEAQATEQPGQGPASLAGVELYPKTGGRRVAVLELEYPQRSTAPSPEAGQDQEVTPP